ncbi:DUF1269 domain-containing protein [Streptomyces sp. NPDC051219]|uniref:DUF1269 domain-containing protein n=1 Tax=Streptomyces sp. NPDC051219 TaxID=3155283 RepID=UPI003422CEC6
MFRSWRRTRPPTSPVSPSSGSTRTARPTWTHRAGTREWPGPPQRAPSGPWSSASSSRPPASAWWAQRSGGSTGSCARSLDNTFRKKVQSLLKPGSAALVIMASQGTEDRLSAELQAFGGTLLKTSLAEKDEKELAEQLAGTE